jgi:hypothetical protein
MNSGGRGRNYKPLMKTPTDFIINCMTKPLEFDIAIEYAPKKETFEFEITSAFTSKNEKSSYCIMNHITKMHLSTIKNEKENI